MFFIYKNKQNITYIQIFKKINMSFKYSYSNLFRLQKDLDPFRFQKNKKFYQTKNSNF